MTMPAALCIYTKLIQLGKAKYFEVEARERVCTGKTAHCELSEHVSPTFKTSNGHRIGKGRDFDKEDARGNFRAT